MSLKENIKKRIYKNRYDSESYTAFLLRGGQKLVRVHISSLQGQLMLIPLSSS